ncbi:MULTISPECIES: hypothetical protein [unclassified Mycobacterium]|uniref:hypothetical protein n=1 Tax=unclassified Mycobacterium TaxID=2642494 RepID=UPI0029C8F969|nr:MULTISPECIES: hypothetical protein [unclassified Mycobacterium]
MSHARSWLAAVMLAAGAATLATAPAVCAEPNLDQSAAAVIQQLTDEGYNVQINWVSGVSSRPLSECAVLGVHNPNLAGGPVEDFTTVYVDVSCPNHDGDSHFDLGVGIGFG